MRQAEVRRLNRFLQINRGSAVKCSLVSSWWQPRKITHTPTEIYIHHYRPIRCLHNEELLRAIIFTKHWILTFLYMTYWLDVWMVSHYLSCSAAFEQWEVMIWTEEFDWSLQKEKSRLDSNPLAPQNGCQIRPALSVNQNYKNWKFLGHYRNKKYLRKLMWTFKNNFLPCMPHSNWEAQTGWSEVIVWHRQCAREASWLMFSVQIRGQKWLHTFTPLMWMVSCVWVPAGLLAVVV